MNKIEKVYRTHHLACPARYSGVTVDTRERVEGDLLVSPDGSYYIGKYVGSNSILAGGRGPLRKLKYMQHLGLYRVHPSSIRECTCVPDKEGRIIFEGDLLRYTPGTAVASMVPGLNIERTFYVYYDTDTLTWMVEATDETSAQFPLYKLNKSNIEILGHTIFNRDIDVDKADYDTITDYLEVKVHRD